MSDRIVKTRVFDSVIVNTTGVITSQIIDVRTARVVQALRIKPTMTAGGNPDFKIDMAVGDYVPLPQMPTDWLKTPATNMDNFLKSVLASWNTAYGTSTDWQTIALPAPFAGFVQFRLTGIGANPSGVQIDAKLEVQESM